MKRRYAPRFDFANVDRARPIDLQHPLMRGVVACWLGPDWGGVNLRDCARRHHMTAIGGPVVRPSRIGKILLFNGSSQYTEYEAAILAAYPITMAGWFNTTDLTRNQIIIEIGKSGATTDRCFLVIAGAVGGDYLSASIKGADVWGQAWSTSGVTAGWHHGVAVFESATSRAVFLDAGSKGTNSTNTTPSGLNLTRFGRAIGSPATDYIVGSLGSQTIWNRALSDREVYEHYIEGLRGFPTILRRTTGFRAFMVTAPPAGNLLALWPNKMANVGHLLRAGMQ